MQLPVWTTLFLTKTGSLKRLIPEYDKESQPYPIPYNHHGDIEVTSNILKVQLSFKWYPLINKNLMKTIRQWTTDPSERPY
ncbi:hypothetical protein OUZ56_020829 [Daphnia magna]|uniref:Uncharacterized protein n=1 Tax=Daphnia magna TaxID=35525 RepID=A0ABQ9ZFK5_9CRUS|nr:hypothetical protein OUZ56_020829 [Daphnia magna]